jgi:hypothetical protein
MKKELMLIIGLVIAATIQSQAQQARIVFYNVENLYDTRDDSLTKDEEFLPGGDKNWTYDRFHCKIVRVYKVLVAMGRGEMPAVVGLCEVENRYVLDRLIYDTPLSRMNYRVIHRESPDARGVDVALLYRPDLFTPDTAEWLRVPLSTGETTREILHVTGQLLDDTVHFYINHWPSRYGGAGTSTGKRLAAAATLASSVKKVLVSDPSARIIIMGDFNDEPGDESLLSINKILANPESGGSFSLINLSDNHSFAGLEGTIKHQGTWSVFDQVIVSGSLLDNSAGLNLMSEKAEIFNAGFLLEKDETYTGFKPFRTYLGPGYHNGFSDHLPVSIVLSL